MVTSLCKRSKVIIQPMKEGNGKRKFELGPIVTHGIQTLKKKPTRSPATRHSPSLYALQANSVATNSRPKWHPMVRGLIPRTLPIQ
ncbi:hypothetical protein O181_012877 [Austropuccinia psidii MF-1]|uniref:Uncharacterized protein n=1 Tax=Austropuccinia psidii MF-1 TaxID=1389203 RepID=A0A9Q3BYJ0_9BASI|nr:hypothetical protein [Austropuccinia psidii MF-1]